MAEDPKEQASDLFMDMICDGGTGSVVCGLCQRLHFATGEHTSLGRTEIDQYRAESDLIPDRYVESKDDAIGVGEIGGKVVAWNCPCHRLRAYEDFIWENRGLIARYLKARTTKELEDSQKMAAALAQI